MSLYECLSSVEDPRRAEGKRTTLEQMFCMIIISNLCGHFGGRPIARFAKIHGSTFEEYLKLKHGVPSHVTFSGLLNDVDDAQLTDAFNEWASSYVDLEEGGAVSGDGKALGSTFSSKPDGSGQTFQAIVSIFCQKTGLVKAIQDYQNAKTSEINVVQFLVQQLHDLGVTIYLDALHTQKNCRNHP